MKSSTAQASDLLLPLAVTFIVGMVIFPLPCAVLDVLLMCNISISLILLLSSVYLSEPDKFTTLPTILLLTTLFRLGLNISTTRQLLGAGAAPDVVVAFGEFVVSGNLVVGAVMYVIITIVQFMVIAKGAERVAEVAARFSLDAMPGKQMAIDADIRAGILSLTEAKERRRDLQRESRLYGALDGAMKFVKGDSIASLLITAINITAGLVIGVTQHEMSIADAVHKYSIFTIGDGLVTQLPALLVAVAAGIVVTRVGDRDTDFMGRELAWQLGREPQALSTAGVTLIGLSAVPGLPTISFFLMGSLLLFLGRVGKMSQHKSASASTVVEFKPKVIAPVLLRLNRQAVSRIQAEGKLLHLFSN